MRRCAVCMDMLPDPFFCAIPFFKPGAKHTCRLCRVRDAIAKREGTLMARYDRTVTEELRILRTILAADLLDRERLYAERRAEMHAREPDRQTLASGGN